MYKIHTEEFKRMAVDLSYNSDKTITQICKELGLSLSLMYKWRKDMNKELKSPDSQEIKELKKRLANAEVENQILKKALAICNRM
jgi:transposase